MKEHVIKQRVSAILNNTDAYRYLERFLVNETGLLLHSDMENFAEELEDFIYNWIVTTEK
jgi:hypothetical protein